VASLWTEIGGAYGDWIVDTGKQPELFLLLSFLLSFGFIRTSAHMIRAQVSWWPGNLQVGGTHVHHLVWGILLMLLVGYSAIAFAPGAPVREVLAILFGVGAGLTLDEFALWLNLEDVYWSEQGRASIDAVIVAAACGGLVLLGLRIWIDVAEDLAAGVEAVVAAGGSGLVALAIGITAVHAWRRRRRVPG
jgi:lysyl-tRNA synthetase class 2